MQCDVILVRAFMNVVKSKKKKKNPNLVKPTEEGYLGISAAPDAAQQQETWIMDMKRIELMW